MPKHDNTPKVPQLDIHHPDKIEIGKYKEFHIHMDHIGDLHFDVEINPVDDSLFFKFDESKKDNDEWTVALDPRYPDNLLTMNVDTVNPLWFNDIGDFNKDVTSSGDFSIYGENDGQYFKFEIDRTIYIKHEGKHNEKTYNYIQAVGVEVMPTSATASVPEPTTTLLLGLSTLVALLRRVRG